MSSEAPMSIDLEILEQITHDLCSTMLGFDVDFSAQQFDGQSAENILGTLSISGERTAGVRIEATPDAARAIGSRLFHMSEDQLSEEDLLDAIGEVTNIIGGNVKGAFGAECDLSLPRACRLGSLADTPSIADVTAVTIRCNQHPLRVSVSESAK